MVLTHPEPVSYQDLLVRPAGKSPGIDIQDVLRQASAGRDLITFSGGYPDPQTFPTHLLPQLLAEAIKGPAACQYGPTAGSDQLREWLLTWLRVHDGEPAQLESLLITSGGMEGLKLVMDAVLAPHDTVLVEAPSFMGAVMALRHAHGRVQGIPLDEDGLDVAGVAHALDAGVRPKFIYVIPDHQNPTGVTMTAERRRDLVALARAHNLLIVEDVAYRELGFDGSKHQSLRAMAPDRVLQLGTFAKIFMPGIRLGWAVGPEPLIAELTKAKQFTDQCASPLGQHLLSSYGRSGAFDQGIAAARRLYQDRWRRLELALSTYLPTGAQFTRAHGGFFTWLTLADGTDVESLLPAASRAGVSYLPGTMFYADGQGADQMRLAFSRVEAGDIEEGVSRLVAVLAAGAEVSRGGTTDAAL